MDLIKPSHLLDRTLVYGHDTWAHTWNGAGGIACCDGALVVTWYSGGHNEPHPENHVLLSRSPDGGKTWSYPTVVCNPEGNVRAADPILWRDTAETLHMAYNVQDLTRNTGDCTWVHQVCEAPAATEIAWSKRPVIAPDFTDFSMMNKPIRLDNDEWLLAAAVRTGHSGGRPNHHGFRAGAALISEDDGMTWHGHQTPEGEYCPYYRDGYAEMVIWEPMAFQRDDSTVVMFARSGWGMILASSSHDRGRTWSQWEPTALPNPCARFHVRKLPDGPVICIDNPNARTGWDDRQPLGLFVSHDDGRAWSHLVILDVEGKTMYPDADLDPDGHTLHIMYENRRDIFYARMDLRGVL